MNNIQNDGGSAFPILPYHLNKDSYNDGSDGMSLRDYFAAHAIGNLIVNESVLEAANEAKQPVSQVVASIAYEIADAMLKVREVKP
jgi:hypothetical protein